MEAEFCDVVTVDFIVLEPLLRAGSDVPTERVRGPIFWGWGE